MRRLITPFFAILLTAMLVQCGSQKEHSLKNIETFAKLYGCIRFFHPSEQAAKINWNHFAIYGIKQVKKAKNTTELKQTLEKLFLPIAPSITIYLSKEKKSFSLSFITPENTTNMKPISWQHRGVKLNNSPNAYNSIRTHRKNKILRGYGFGNLFQDYHAKPYRKKEILLKATVKALKGKAQLWLRLDNTAGKTSFFDNMYDRPIQSQQWTTYQIKAKTTANTQNIAFGCFLNGSGQIFIDDFQLLVKEENQWVPINILNPGFEENPENKTPKYWWTRGKGYSFQVTAQAAATGKKCAMIESKTVKGPDRLFEQQTTIGQHINKKIGNNLSCIIPLALYGTIDNTYPTPPANALENLIAAIKTGIPDNLGATDPDVRLADVIITWNVFQHFYPYFDIVKINWNHQLTHTLQKAQSDKNEKDFLLTLREMTAQLQDCNANVYHPTVKNMAGFPFKTGWIENQVVITASQDKRFQRGDIILSIDGVNAEKTLLKAEIYISGSSPWKRHQSLSRFGWGDKNTTALLKIKRDGKIIKITAARTFNGQIKEFLRKPIQKLKNNIYYIDLAQIKGKEFKAALEQLTKAKGIIFDARDYVAYEKRHILGFLVDEPIQTPIWHFPEIIYPDREKIHYTDLSGKVFPQQPKITAKAVFLVHGYTINASETFIGMVEHYKLGEIIGEPTAGTNGNINAFTLPGGYTVFWTGMRVLKHDHSQHHLLGITPTIPVKRTINAIKQGKDEFLEKAIEIILQSAA